MQQSVSVSRSNKMNCCNTLLRVKAFVLFFAKVYFFLIATPFFLINNYANDIVSVKQK